MEEEADIKEKVEVEKVEKEEVEKVVEEVADTAIK
jgi:hypothetical protein